MAWKCCDILPKGKSVICLSSPVCKNTWFTSDPNHRLISGYPVPLAEGRIAIVTDVGQARSRPVLLRRHREGWRKAQQGNVAETTCTPISTSQRSRAYRAITVRRSPK